MKILIETFFKLTVNNFQQIMILLLTIKSICEIEKKSGSYVHMRCVQKKTELFKTLYQ